jgi:hypothetical protein
LTTSLSVSSFIVTATRRPSNTFRRVPGAIGATSIRSTTAFVWTLGEIAALLD